MLRNSTSLSKMRNGSIILSVVVGILAGTLATPVSAHEGRDVGDYNLVVGFLREPAYEGQLNGVSLVVTKTSTEDAMETHRMETEDGDHEMTSMMGTDTIDVITHGAVFTSPQFGSMENFEFEVTEELSGIEIPYHVHPGDQEGIIVVSSDESHGGEDQSIMIMDDHVMPARLKVNVGDNVVWMNHENQNAVVMSGPLSSMTTEMTTMMSSETPSVTAETATTRDRVTGLASTLKVEVHHLPTDAAREMSLTEMFADPGHYVAEFVPTAPGDYSMRFFGSIEGNAIDETFYSGPNTFDTVVASDAIQFPVVLESNREIQNATKGAIDAVQQVETDLEAIASTANTGIIIGIIGILIGIVATGTSAFAISVARRRN